MPPKKKGGKRKDDDYWENEFEQDAQTLLADSAPGAPAVTEAGASAEKPPADEPGDADDLMAMLNRKKAAKKAPAKAKDDAKATQALDGEDGEDGEFKIKSKKEKEREKKERQKEAKKKTVQDKKVVEKAEEVLAPVAEKKAPAKPQPVVKPDTSTPTAAVKEEEDDDDEDDDDGKGDKKKKKKKKKKPEEEKKEEPAAKGKKKAPVAAIKKLLEAQRQAELEQQRKEEEERLRIEEEERKQAEEERLKEEAKRLKKEKEKAKKEQLRKEGKLLTKAQKEAKLKAQRNLQMLLDSGVVVPALQEAKEGDEPRKKVIYGSKIRKKKTEPTEKKVEETLPAPVIEEKKRPVAPEEKVVEDKEDWEISSEEEKAPPPVDEKSSSSESESESESQSEPEPEVKRVLTAEEEKKKEAADRREKKHQEALAARTRDDLRSPICVILGHVDTGKTKLLDKIRQTNVQEGEAGGITQQIGATYFPIENIKTKTRRLGDDVIEDYKVPGLLVIDTPGHESFTNLRSRGSSLCNIAILVVDIMHGLEPQTLESLRLLRDRKTPFIVALNKIDRIFEWQPVPDNGFRDSLSKQQSHVKREFEDRVKRTITAFAEQGLNSCLYYENRNFAKYVSLVPTSAITGEGIPDMLHLLVHLTQTRMSDKLMYLSELQATVLEVKMIEGFGTTIDVILSNGVLNEGDRIVLCGLNGPIATNIRALLTPQPLRELRVKSQYVHHKSIKAAMGVKISAPDLDKAIAGSRLLVVGSDDDEDDLMEEVMEDLASLQKFLDKSGKGVSVQSSTLGSLEALLEFLKVSKIPVAVINIGPVHKKDITRCSTMLERAKEFAVMLCFDVKVDKDAQELADDMGVKMFKADIIYHLFDQFTAYNKEILEQKRKDQAPQAIFPCILKIVPGCVFNKRDPIVLGVDVIEGVLRTGTPVCVISDDPDTKKREIMGLGKVTSIEQNHKAIDAVKRGQAAGGVAIKIECPTYETPKMVGRHFTEQNEIYSFVTRGSIDVLKESFRNDLSKDEWALIVKLKKILDIQ